MRGDSDAPGPGRNAFENKRKRDASGGVPFSKNGSGSRTRTCDIWINSPPFYQLNYAGPVEARTGIEPVYTALQAAA